MANEKALRTAAKEMNEVMDGLDPELDVKAKLTTLEKQMKEAVKFIDPDEDTFSKATQAVIDELTEEEEEEEEEEESIKKVKGKKAPEPEDEDEEEEEEKQERANKLHKKNIGKAKTRAPKVEDNEEEEEEDESKAKKAKKKGPIKKAGKEGGPGIIQTIVSLVEKAGKKGVSKKEILEQLKEDFPDRNEQSMKNTINVQVPARINKEKFPVKKVGDDRYTKA